MMHRTSKTALAAILAFGFLFVGASGAPTPLGAGVSSAVDETVQATPVVDESPPATPIPIVRQPTIEELRADPELLEEVLSQADCSRPIQVRPGEVDPVLIRTGSDNGSDTPCPDGQECP